MYQSVWLFRHPEVVIAQKRIIITYECRLTGSELPSHGSLCGRLTLSPVAVAVLDETGGGKLALVPTASLRRVEALLSEETRWAEVV